MLKALSNTLKLQPEQNPGKNLYLYIFMAYLFGVFIRLILLYQVKDIPSFWIDGNPLPIWEADSGLHGFYAKQILNGISYPFIPEYIPGYFIAFVTNQLDANINFVMVLLPVLLAPLIVIPIILIGKAMRLTTFGFLSALISVIGINYYIRSRLGYMDTDVLNLFFLLFTVYFMIQVTITQKILYALGAGVSILVFSLWYHSSPSINITLTMFFLLFTLLFHRKNSINYQAFILFSVALIPYEPSIILALLIVLTIFFIMLNIYKTFSYLYYLILLLIGSILIVSLLDLSLYYDRALLYFNKDTINSFSGNGITYYYTNFLQFVSEVRTAYLWEPQPFFDGLLPYTLIATLGFILLGIAYPTMFILFPLLALGYLSTYVGIRFTLYASPVLAFGIVYVFYVIRNIINNNYPNRNILLHLPRYGVIAVVILMLHNILLINAHIKYQGFPLQSDEAKLLKDFSKKLSKEDKIVTWWDYGWPIWYYTGYQNTLADNGLHGGPDTHIISKILMSTDQNFTANTAKYFSEKFDEAHQNHSVFVLPYLSRSQDLTTLLDQLKYRALPTQNNNDTYIVLHRGMLDFYGIISQFSASDLKTGKGKSQKILISSSLTKPFSVNNSLIEGESFIFDSSKGILHHRNKMKMKINEVTLTDHHKQNYAYLYHYDSPYYIIIEDKKHAFYMNKEAYQSFLVQAMLLDIYDHTLFEKVGESKQIKIFKVKK